VADEIPGEDTVLVAPLVEVLTPRNHIRIELAYFSSYSK
jgi:hypothetical protein